MSKQNQYYSEWNDAPVNEYYRDQTRHETDAVYYNQSGVNEAPADWKDNPANDNAVDVSDDYYEPYAATHGDKWSDNSSQQNDEHFSHDSERGFNRLYESALSEVDTSTEIYFDDTYHDQSHSPHDEQNIVGDLMGQRNSSGIQVYADDLMDCPQKPPGFQIPKPLVVISAACFFVGLGAALIHSSKPDLTAYDIVKMESYDGIQQAPAIFNLTNLEECASQSDCIKESLNASKADIAEYTQITSAIREIPAANTIAAEESRTISFDTVDTVVSVAPGPEQLQVQAQWSNVRAAPDMSGSIVTSLAKGTVISVLSSSGNWYEIRATNDQQHRGFMHRSTVEPVSY